MYPTHLVFAITLVIFFDIVSYIIAYKNNYDPAEEEEIPVNIKLLGDLATPHPDAGIDLGFVPKQVYYQVRRYDTKKKVPQSEALKEASTAEEVINAPRLREVLTHKKTQEVYEEQGYEDAGYDHGGSARHKQENEHLLEKDTVDNGKDDDSPNHLPDEQGEDEQPSEENSESDSQMETLSEMNSDTRQRKMKPDRATDKARDRQITNDEKKKKMRTNGQNKVTFSSSMSEKQVKKYPTDGNSNRRSDERRRRKKANGKKMIHGSSKQRVGKRMDGPQLQDQPKQSRTLNFDVEKFPFYNILNSNKYTKHSALKYALNPKEIPVKVSNQMSFYDSRKLHCDEITPPEVETPDGEEKNPDNSELKNPNRGKPRMGKLGHSIDCLKRKFFGHDPLDNPFFKESFDSQS